MKQVNTTYWKVFRVGVLFDIHPTKAYKLTNVQLIDGGRTPVVVNSAYNNGIGGYSTLDATEKGNMITFSDTVDANTIFYQKEDFVGYPHVQGMYPTGMFKDKWRPYSLMFFASLFRKTAVSKGFDYGNKFRRDIAIDIKLKLPSTPDGSPDWKYMEEYMRKIEQRTQNTISAFLASQNKPHKIDTTYWKEFIMEELFEKLDLRFWPKKFEKTKHVSTEKTEEFNIPLVNAKHSNNGIMYYGREIDFESEEMTIDIVADGAASTGDVYPQPQRTGVLYNAYLIKLKERKSSKAVLCFLSTVIERCVKQKFGYDNKCTWDKLKQEKILLPATPSGIPDWHYMEMYMRGVEAIVKNKLSLLVPHKSEVAIKDAANVTFNNATVTYIDQSKTYNVK